MNLFKCIKKCWHGDKLWEVGEVMETNADSHPHFAPIANGLGVQVSHTVKVKAPTSEVEVEAAADGEPSLLNPEAVEPKAAIDRAHAGDPVALSEITGDTKLPTDDAKTLGDAGGLLD